MFLATALATFALALVACGLRRLLLQLPVLLLLLLLLHLLPLLVVRLLHLM